MSEKNFWGGSSLNFDEISLRYSSYLGKYEFNIIGFNRFNTTLKDKNHIVFDIKYKY